jgi:site-specific DNA recombinase
MHRLEIDELAAPVVGRIFDEYIAGRGLRAIAEALTQDAIPSPSAHDPARNRHRQSSGGAWSKSAIRSILCNPRYTGRQVWNRQRRDEDLVDIENVALGHVSKMRWNDRADWVWSADVVHEPIVDAETFAEAQRIMAVGRSRPLTSKRPEHKHTYILSGIVTCALCKRRMAGQQTGGRSLYRCRYPLDYVLAEGIGHPRSVAVGERVIIERLDEWLLRLFDDDNIDETVDALVAAQGEDSGGRTSRTEAANKKLVDCDRRLGKLRAALEADADPTVVGQWIREVQGERLAAERALVEAKPPARLSREQLRAMLSELDIAAAVRNADAKAKRDLYASLGLELTYDPGARRVRVRAEGWATVRVGGGT